MVKTLIFVSIGNSDDKLKQHHWAAYVRRVHGEIVYAIQGTYPVEGEAVNGQLHFAGFSPSDAPFQNACWGFELVPHEMADLKAKIQLTAGLYRQESFHWAECAVSELVPGLLPPHLSPIG